MNTNKEVYVKAKKIGEKWAEAKGDQSKFESVHKHSYSFPRNTFNACRDEARKLLDETGIDKEEAFGYSIINWLEVLDVLTD